MVTTFSVFYVRLFYVYFYTFISVYYVYYVQWLSRLVFITFSLLKKINKSYVFLCCSNERVYFVIRLIKRLPFFKQM